MHNNSSCTDVVAGYRHIDTAQAYGNERGVGEGMRTCGVPREELFVVSKVADEHKTYEEAYNEGKLKATVQAADSLFMEVKCNMKKTYIIYHMMISIDGRGGVDTVSVLKVEAANHQQYVEMTCRLFDIHTCNTICIQ